MATDFIAKIGANITEYLSAMDEVVGKASKTVDQVEGRLAAFGNIGASLASVGASLTAAVTVPILGIGAAILASGKQFDSASDTIRIGTGAIGDQLKSLEGSFKAVFAQVPSTAAAASTAIADLNTRLGLTGKPLEDLAAQVLNLARITGSEVGPIIASSTRLFGDWSVATGQQSAALDYMFRVSQSTGIGINRLMELVVQFGAPLRALGFNLQEGAALLGKWEKEGVNLETVLSGMRFALGNFAKAGLEPKTALENIISAIKNAKTESEATALAFTTFGKRAATDMSRAIIEGRLNITDLVASLKGSKETINSAAADTADFAEQWQLFKNKLVLALEPLGTPLFSALSAIGKLLTPLAEGVATAAKWFAELPTPVLAAVGAIAAIVAGIGPLLVAVGGLGLAIPAVTAGLAAIAGITGVAIAPMLGIAAAVAGVVVALTALGSWVYANWEPIKATVLQAWSGLSDLWSAAWSPVTAFLEGIWSTIAGSANSIWGGTSSFLGNIWGSIAPYFTATWNAIGSALSTVWNGIRSAAESVWGAVVGAIDGFLKWANKIPGVNKLFNLDVAWSNAAKLATETKKATEETKKATTAHAAFAPVIKAGAVEVGKYGKAHEDASDRIKKFSAQQQQHAIRLYESAEAIDKAERELAILNQQITKGEGPLEEWTAALASSKVEIDRLTPDMVAFGRVMDTMASDTALAADSLGDAFKRQRITSSAELKATADQAKIDLTTISDSHVATKGEVDAAWHAMMEAEIAYRKALGDNVAPLEAELAKYDNAHKNLQKKVKDTWTQIQSDITTAIDSFGGALVGLGEDLLTGDFSLDKVGAAFKDLGLDIADAFLKVGAQAITDFIKNHIGALLNALGSVLDKIPIVGDALGGIFKAGGSAVGTAGGAVGAAGKAAGSVGGGGAGAASGVASSGITGVIGAVAGVASAISSIVGNFQMAKMETSLNAIEENTRYSKAYDLLNVTLGLSYWPQIENIRDFLWGTLIPAVAETISEIQHMGDWLNGMTDILSDLRNLAIDLRTYATGTFELIRDEIVTRLAGTNQTGESILAPILDTTALNVDTSELGSAMVAAIDRLGSTLSQAKIQPANITLAPTIDASGQLSTMNNTLSGISMMMARGLGLTAPKGGEFEFISPSIVAAIGRAENAVVAALTTAGRYLADMAAAQSPLAVGGGVTVNVDLRGSMISGNDMVDRLATEITDRVRRITR